MRVLTTLLLSVTFLSVGEEKNSAPSESDLEDNLSVSYSEILDNHYKTALSRDLYSRMTKWNHKSEIPPPIAPQKVLELATGAIRKIAIPDKYHWKMTGIILRPVMGLTVDRPGLFNDDDKWIWYVSFQLGYDAGSTGVWPNIGIFVTMDGDVIEPQLVENAEKK